MSAHKQPVESRRPPGKMRETPDLVFDDEAMAAEINVTQTKRLCQQRNAGLPQSCAPLKSAKVEGL